MSDKTVHSRSFLEEIKPLIVETALFATVKKYKSY